MIRKLLLIVKHFFTTIFNEKTFIPGVKLLCLGMFFVASFANSQVANYTFSQSNGTYTAITGATGATNAATTWDDGVTANNIPIGFTFTFNGANYTSCSINYDGYITFNGASANQSRTPISGNSNTYSGAISPFALDLLSGGTSDISYKTNGTTPNRTFIVEWKNAKRFNGGARDGSLNFQIVLNESTNIVQVIYGTCTTNTDSLAAEVGLRGASNGDYNNRSVTTSGSTNSWSTSVAGITNGATCSNNSTRLPASGLTFTWTPGLCSFSNFGTVTQITNVKFNSLDNTSTGTTSYENFTGLTPTTVYRDQSYSLNVKGNTGGNVNYYYTAFFDWNQDGDFLDAGEYTVIGTFRNSPATNVVASVFVKIPNTANLGNTKMRIIGHLGSYNTTPCAASDSNNAGQVEDYTITVGATCTATPSPGGTNSTANPVCSTTPFTLSLANETLGAPTYQWQTSINGTDWVNATPSQPAFFSSDFSTPQAANSTVGVESVSGLDAKIAGGVLILTDITETGHQSGYFINKSLGSNVNAFTASFDYKIWTGPTDGADGMSLSYGGGFVNSNGGGENGEGNGLILKLDTYDNDQVAVGGRIRIDYGGNAIFATAIGAIVLRDLNYRNITLTVDNNGYLSLTLAGTPIVSNLLLPGYTSTDKSTWKFKFSARTGGNKDQHSIDNLTIKYLDVSANKSIYTTSQTVPTYYRALVTCGSNTTPSTGVLVNMISAVIAPQTASICSAVGFTVNPTGTIPTGTTYSWGVPTVTGGAGALTGGASATAQTNITGTLTNTTTTTQTATYTVTPTTSGCVGATFTVTVTVNPKNTITLSSGTGTNNQTKCNGTALTNITFTTTGATDASVTGLPSGVSGSWAVNVLTISGTPTQVGSFPYTVNLIGGCGTVTTTGTITVNALPVISQQPQPLEICQGQNGSFTIVTSASSPTYQWQYSTSATGPWTVTNAAAGVSGHNTAMLSLTNVPLNYSGYYLRCTLTSNTCSTSSTPALLTVNPLPTAPTPGTPSNVTCISTGSVTLTNLPAGNWTLVRNPGAVSTTGTGSTYTVNGLAVGNYTFTVSNGSCTSPVSSIVPIGDQSSTTWNVGTGWSAGPPNNSKAAIINGAFTVSSDLTACSLTINPGIAISVPSNYTITVVNALTVTPSASLTFENHSSLVQVNDNAVNSGSITYKRIAPQIRLADFVYWSTPVSPQKLVDVSSLTLSDKYMGYNGTNWVVTNKNSNMVVGKGYIIRGPQTYSTTVKQDFPAEFKGVPNNGIISGETLVNNKYYLIGNPYPSALNAKKFLDDNSLLLKGTLYFWTHNTPVVLGGAYRYTSDDYATYNLTGSTIVRTPAISGNTPGNTPVAPTGYIGAGQSFFALSKSAGTVTFNNGMRAGLTAAENTQFFKSASKEADYEKHRVWLNITNTEGAFKQMLVGYIEGATNEYEDRYDGGSFNANPYIDFYSIGNGRKYTIQGRALPFEDTDEVPLGYSTTITGNFTIAIDQVDGNLTRQAIYLEDKKTNVIHDLKAGDYTFTTEKGTYADRFVLRYTSKTLGTGDFENTQNGLLVSVKEKTIKVTSSQENIKEVTIFDVSGKLLYNKKKVGSTELQIQNLPSANQVLLVKVTLENDFTTTKKIIFN